VSTLYPTQENGGLPGWFLTSSLEWYANVSLDCPYQKRSSASPAVCSLLPCFGAAGIQVGEGVSNVFLQEYGGEEGPAKKGGRIQLQQVLDCEAVLKLGAQKGITQKNSAMSMRKGKKRMLPAAFKVCAPRNQSGELLYDFASPNCVGNPDKGGLHFFHEEEGAPRVSKKS